MAYDTIEPHVRGIIKGTRNAGGLNEAIATLSLEDARRTIDDSEGSDGSEKKGYLEEAITSLETAYKKCPNSEIATILAETYRLLGDVKRASGMPGYEDDYTRSAAYQERAKELTKPQRGPERHYPDRRF